MMKKPDKTTGNQVRYRKETRRSLRSEISIDSGNGFWRLFPLADLSQHGCNLGQTDWPFRVGQFLSLKVEGTVRTEGIVRWVRDGQIGIEFVRPLSAAIVERILPPD